MSRRPSPAVAAKRRRVLALVILTITALAVNVATTADAPANGLQLLAVLTAVTATGLLVVEFEHVL